MKISLEFSTIAEMGEWFRLLDRKVINGTSVNDLEISTRARNTLRAAGIETIEQLLGKTYVDLLQIPNCGRGTVDEIEAGLVSVGFRGLKA